MPLSHVTIETEFGAALHQNGLNTISAGLRLLRPDLFAKSTDIVVKPADPGPPPVAAHVLTLYAFVDDPIAFSLYPIPNAPTLPVDSFFVKADITFTLTDSLLGIVTRIGAVIEAAGTIIVDSAGNMDIAIGTKPDGSEYLDVVDLRGEQPELTSALVRGSVDAGAQLQRVYNADDNSDLGRTFRAIVNYLIDLYLRGGLRRTISEFPVPPLNNLIQFGALGSLPIDRLYIRNNSLYASIGARDGGPAPFPLAPAVPVDIRFGASQTGVARLINSLMPIPIPDGATGNDHTTFQFWTQGLEVSSIDIRLQPGQPNPIGLNVHIDGTVGFQINLDCGPFGWIHVPIPVPLDPLTGYYGAANAYIEVDQYSATNPSAEVRVTILPDTHFFDNWIVIILPNYRSLFYNEVKKALDDISNKILGSSFCQIPVIGWIACGVIKVIDVVGPVIAYILGGALDLEVGADVTALVNTIGRAILQFIHLKPFKIASINQAKIRGIIGTTIASGSCLVQDNGRAGEITLQAWFSNQGLPIVPLPVPPSPAPLPNPPGPPPTTANTLPEFGPEAFAPAANLGAPVFKDGASLNFTVKTTVNGAVTNGSMHVTIQRQAQVWYLRTTLLGAQGNAITTTVAAYSFATGSPLRSETTTTFAGGIVLRDVVDYSVIGRAEASVGIDGQPSAQRGIDLRAAVLQEIRETWIFRFAYTPLTPLANQVVALVDIADANKYVNWDRQVPLVCTVTADTVPGPTAAAPRLAVWRVTGTDADNTTTLVVNRAGGLLSAKVSNVQHATTVEISAQ